jgi:hypothetical protein
MKQNHYDKTIRSGLSVAWLLLLAFGFISPQCHADSADAVHVSDAIPNLAAADLPPADYWTDLGLAAVSEDKESDSAVSETGSNQSFLGVPQSKDPAGLRRDTVYFVSYQVVSLGLLYIAPTSVSNWTPEDKDNVNFEKWWNNVSDPKWDTDKWWINYALHPYWGAAYFVRARMRGYDSRESFWYSFALSSMYEFGVEAIFEEPSIQDIFVTPALGSVLGSAFMNIRENIYAKQYTEDGLDKWDWLVLGLTDPLGWLNGKFDSLFGYETQVSLTPFHGKALQARTPGSEWERGPNSAQEDDDVYGLRFSVRF